MKVCFPILAPCRTYRRAAVCRVAGGALPKRGRGCAGNGRGQATEPPKRRVRGGFLPRAGAQRQGRRVSVPFLKMAVPKSKVPVPLLNLALPLICRNSSLPCRRVAGGAVARDAQPYRLQRFERTGVEKKRHDAHEGSFDFHPHCAFLFVRKLMFCKVAVLLGSALATAPHYKTCGIAMFVKSLGDNTIHAPRRPHRRVAGGASVEMEAA